MTQGWAFLREIVFANFSNGKHAPHFSTGLEADRPDRGRAQEGPSLGAEDHRVVSHPRYAADVRGSRFRLDYPNSQEPGLGIGLSSMTPAPKFPSSTGIIGRNSDWAVTSIFQGNSMIQLPPDNVL